MKPYTLRLNSDKRALYSSTYVGMRAGSAQEMMTCMTVSARIHSRGKKILGDAVEKKMDKIDCQRIWNKNRLPKNRPPLMRFWHACQCPRRTVGRESTAFGLLAGRSDLLDNGYLDLYVCMGWFWYACQGPWRTVTRESTAQGLVVRSKFLNNVWMHVCVYIYIYI